MDALLRFFTAGEVWVYLIIALVGLVYSRRLVRSIQEWRGTVFGLERNNAQRRLSEAISVMSLLALLALGEFVLVTFVSPALPGLQVLQTPTLSVLETPRPNQQGTASPIISSTTPDALPPQPTLVELPGSCTPGQIEFSSPTAGQEVKGKVTLLGTVKVANFGFYKYEFTQPGTNSWVTVQAGDLIRCPGTECINPAATETPGDELGTWDTSLLAPGDYLLRLVVTDNQGKSLPACVISVRVIAATTGE